MVSAQQVNHRSPGLELEVAWALLHAALDCLDRIVETGTLDDQTTDELTQLCKTAGERFLKENPEAGLA